MEREDLNPDTPNDNPRTRADIVEMLSPAEDAPGARQAEPAANSRKPRGAAPKPRRSRRSRGAEGERASRPPRTTTIDQDALDDLVGKINALDNFQGWARVEAIGSVVVATLWSDMATYVIAKGVRSGSYRQLRAHGGLEMSAAALSYIVRTHALVSTSAAQGVHPGEHLRPKHLRPLLGLELDEQVGILREAAEGDWSPEEIARAAEDAKGSRKSRGRPPVPPLLRDLYRLVKLLDDDLLADLDGVAELSPEAASQARSRLKTATRAYSVVGRRIMALKEALEARERNEEVDEPS